ncbi:unnamed protein product [Kluyveromyces dobzhanskii CBS 2104]|uniref:WGS project CCBQ000000000 data, contig 00099 n=1 Tax=Kluyveromyces dobzhanskii CBS 2104 TaxID=1427455 RepID=A0A0A8L2H5_9SACH|nr:unnamed protein product [Kluyveromyces dobzhanskii CBS 2104]
MSSLNNATSPSYAETEPIEIPVNRDDAQPFVSSLQGSQANSEAITTSTRLIDSSSSSIDQYGSGGITPQEISQNITNSYFDQHNINYNNNISSNVHTDPGYIKHNGMSQSFIDNPSGVSSSLESGSGPHLRRSNSSGAYHHADTESDSSFVHTPVKAISELREQNLPIIKKSESLQSDNGSEKNTETYNPQQHHMDIATFPTNKLLDMLTGLLTKIIKSNDSLGSAPSLETYQGKNVPLMREILSFKGKQVPGITLKQYFQRIQKYCPTTNDVLLSLLVHFDRIAKKCNAIAQEYMTPAASSTNKTAETSLHHPSPQLFVMDSHNIHRLIIAAITVSTKFISDFFYSNSRYARVGGISLQELNHLELQFLILCDFRLIISVEELQRYADLLYKFWDKETQTAQPVPQSDAPSTA